MTAVAWVAKSINIVALAVALILAMMQPWQSAHLYVPIQAPNYLAVDNRHASWTLRIGHVGGVGGFDCGFTPTDPNQWPLLQERKPFPLDWIMDWGFKIRGNSPYALASMPLYFPALVLGIWPLLSIIRRLRHGKEQGSIQPTRDSPKIR